MKKVNVIFWLVAFCLCICSQVVKADIIHIPGDQATIQAGINAAVDGDTVLVSDGTYYENINFKGKSITVASHYILDESEYHINSTIIDGSQRSHPDSGSVVYFISGEDTNSVLTGLTITGGSGTVYTYPPNFLERDGGGIFIESAGAKIENNRIVDNNISTSGDTAAWAGALQALGEDGDFIVIRNNIFSENSTVSLTPTSGGGGTISLGTKERLLFEKNQVTDNVCSSGIRSMGGGLLVFGDFDYVGPYMIRDNVFSGNKTSANYGGGGGICVFSAGVTLQNNIITDNIANGSWGGGGILFVQQNPPATGTFQSDLINNTIVNNSTNGNGGGIRVTGSHFVTDVKNTILWGNSGAQLRYEDGSSGEVSFSDIQGGFSGQGNIDANPLLESVFTCLLTATSPCVDAGDPNTIFDDPEDPVNPGFALWPAMGGLRSDIGAYGGPNSGRIILGLEVSPLVGLPNNFELLQNYPNPFNPVTTIEFTIAKAGWVTLKVYNLLGEEVNELVNENLTANSYKYVWNAENLASGVYFYQLEAAGTVASRKMVLIR